MMHIHLKSKSLSPEYMENFISLIVCVFREKNKRSNHYIILMGTSEDKKKCSAATYINATHIDQRSTIVH